MIQWSSTTRTIRTETGWTDRMNCNTVKFIKSSLVDESRRDPGTRSGLRRRVGVRSPIQSRNHPWPHGADQVTRGLLSTTKDGWSTTFSVTVSSIKIETFGICVWTSYERRLGMGLVRWGEIWVNLVEFWKEFSSRFIHETRTRRKTFLIKSRRRTTWRSKKK